MKRTTIKDVAKLAGVSISSVSRYLSDPDSINPIAAVAVGNAIKELQYVPNPFAQNLKSDSTRNIAVVMPDLSNQFFGAACRAMGRIFYQAKYFVLMCDTDNDPEKERHYVDEMLKSRIAGILIASSGRNTAYLNELIQAGQNIVLFDRWEPDVAADVVCEDDRGAYELTRQLIEQGHTRFIVLNGAQHATTAGARWKWVRQAIEEAGLAVEEEFVASNLQNRAEATDTLDRMLGRPGAPTCIIACNPILLDSAVYTVSKRKLRVPEDVAVAGFSIEDPRYTFPFPVTAVLQDPDFVGMKAAELMLKRLRTKTKTHTPKRIILPTKLVP